MVLIKHIRRCTRRCIIFFLAASVFVPILLLSGSLRQFDSEVWEEPIEDLSSIKYRTDAQKLNTMKKEEGESLKEPQLLVYRGGDLSSMVSYGSSEGSTRSEQSGYAKSSTKMSGNGTNSDSEKEEYQQAQVEKPTVTSGKKEMLKEMTGQHKQNVWSQTRRVLDKKVKEIKDQLIRAKAYLKFAPPSSKSQLAKDLRLGSKELEQAVGDSTKDSDLSRSVLQRMKAMKITLSKANYLYRECPVMATKLRALTCNAEEELQAEKNQVTFLVQLAGRTIPKSLHCLAMRLTAEYFALQPSKMEFPSQPKLHDPDLFHFAVFSNNILACAVVVNSTVSSSSEPEKIVFHVVTDSLNLPAMSMWFLLNPPGKSTIQIQTIDSFEWLSKHGTTLQKQNSNDPRYASALNHLRFYLPEVFPLLNKIVFLDHDVVVQSDLAGLWSVNMKGKVNAAVETCEKGEHSFRQMEMFVNFSDPTVANKFDRRACSWAFGMNMFDLQEWRRENLTGVYQKYLQRGSKKPDWEAGSLPLGWVTFYNHTVSLDKKWHVLGLGYDSDVSLADIEQAAVIHFDGIKKPWLDIGLEEYKGYWKKYVDYKHPYLQQCNMHR
ncbi:probable galacturonosyltransferase 6 isoform X2 [Diospyros lotus]|uniref:probable galacturonosyltransferase 6 isoform X2 n=1 Tax=Diospyros lotus TaxID=55363 RepID=UPI002252234A|nr:probable galacturonosyltransferase 6 isoform X2 [Diospyros lotus]